MTLLVAPCSHEAARFAAERWHYSGQLPTGKLVKFGAWEGVEFVGAVVFSRGASPWLGKAYGLDQTELCELTRVALRDHASPVSQIVARSVRLLRSTNPGLRLVVSFADPSWGHHGGIYQAGNWIYSGVSDPVDEYFVGGRWRHKKGVWYGLRAAGRQGKYLPVVESGRTVPFRSRPGKHRYLMALDRSMRRRAATLALPFPMKPAVEGSMVSRPGSSGEGQVRPLPTAPLS